MDLYYDKKVAYDIAHNPVQNDCAKYVEVGKHFVKEKLEAQDVWFPFVKYKD